MGKRPASTFLTAEWRKLIMANYAVDPAILAPYVPRGTELDAWEGVCYASLVGFLFEDVRVKGIAVPFHRTFEEVNLRFYVRYRSSEGWRRGVVFVKEIVPLHAITLVANTLYRENYQTLPMRHSWEITDEELAISYEWKLGNDWQTLALRAHNNPTPILPGSAEEFITEHYWGYARYNDTTTNQYEVTHPRWDVYPVIDHTINIDCGRVYGEEFSGMTDAEPVSVFLAEGSEISVKSGGRV